MTQVVGSLSVALTIVLAVLGLIATRRQPRWLGPAVIVVGTIAVGLQTWQAIGSSAAEQNLQERATRAVRFLGRAVAAWWPTSPDGWLAIFTGLLALFTLLLVWVGCLQRRTLDATLRSNRVVERAYVDLSHEPPGLELSAPSAPPAADVAVRVKNHGNTPAEVTAVSLRLWINQAPLPADPEPLYAPPQPIRYFLTTRDDFSFSQALPITTSELRQILAGTPAYVLGYVEYRDIFRGRHRYGYARKYDRQRAGNNLIFVTEPGYNYDREL